MSQDIRLENTFRPFGFRVVDGSLTGVTGKVKSGQNAAIGTTPETFWLQGGAYTWQAAAAVLDITSTDVDDDGAPVDTGARTIVIEGLDANYEEISETVIMNGQTAVLTTNSYLRVNRMSVATTGSTNSNEGIIYASTGAQTAGVPDVAATIRMTIAVGEGESRAALYTVPAGKTAYVTNVIAATSEVTDNLLVTLRARASGSASWFLKDAFVILSNTIQIPHYTPLVIAAQSDIELIGDAVSNTVDAYGSFSLILADA